MGIFRKVVVGISGGVDSAVAALLLKNKGFNVHGVFMKNWDIVDETGHCSSIKDWEDAQMICDKLRIPIHQVDFVKHYWNDVFEYFLAEYQNGMTPNPDIKCNKHIKFNKFYAYAREHLSADAIATGHYARTTFGNFLENHQPNQNTKLLCAADPFKDQTFFLSQIPQASLQRTMFPLGNMLKSDVKRLAGEAGLTAAAERKESMGICFVGKRKFDDFIAEYIDTKPGDIVNFDTGAIVGHHKGIHHYTLGQRMRLGGRDIAMFSFRKMSDGQTIVVSPGTNHPTLFSNIIYTEPPYWVDRIPQGFEQNGSVFECHFRFQHRKPLVKCWLTRSSSGLLIKLEKPLKALTPGQFAVLYENDECLGSAKILMPGPSMIYGSEDELKAMAEWNDYVKPRRKKKSATKRVRTTEAVS